MILSVIVMLMLIGITSKIHKMVSKSMETVSLISQYVVLPFTYLSSLLGGLSGGEREVTKKKVSTAKKK